MSQHTPEPMDCAIRPACCSVHDAAPDLLAALEETAPRLHVDDGRPCWCRVEWRNGEHDAECIRARDAIRKATTP